MSRALYCFCFLAAFLIFSKFPVKAQSPVYKNYSVSDGLPSQVVYCVLQDKQGYMWFGTDAGACRFDGRHFQNFTTKDGLTDNEILNLFEDSRGRIWFMTLNGTLCYFSHNAIYNEKNDAQLRNTKAKSQLWSFTEDSHRNIWIGSVKREVIVLKSNGEKKMYVLDSNRTSGVPWIYFYEPDDSHMWVLTMNHIFNFEHDHFSEINPGDLLSLQTYYLKLQNLNPQHAILSSSDGIRSLQNGASRLIVPKEKIPDFPLILRMHVDEDEGIWLLTQNRMTYHLKKGANGYSVDGNFLAGLFVSECRGDNEGNKWFCTIGEGIFKLLPNHQYIKIFNSEESNREAWSVAVDSKNNIWYGTSRGFLCRISNDGVSTFNANSSNDIYSQLTQINFDRAGNIWCTLNSGVSFLKKKVDGTCEPPKRIKLLLEDRNNEEGPNYGAKCLRFDRNGLPFVSANNGILELVQKNQDAIFKYMRLPSLGAARIYSLYFDAQNKLWFDNLEKLYCYHDRAITTFPSSDNEFLSQITDINVISDSTLIIATYGSGIKFFRDGRIINQVSSANGLAGDLCRRLFTDGSTIYVATNQGFSYFTYRNNTVSDLKTYTTADGIISNDVKDIFATNNNIFIATSLGLCAMDKQISQLTTTPPALYITSLSAADSSYGTADVINLKYKSDFTINYIAVTFEQPEKVTYQYQLSNDKDQWIETKNTSINFSSLSPGKYTFRIMAKKYNSGWCNPVNIQFKVLPPVWMEWWFLLLIAVLMIGIIIYIVRVVASRRFQKQLAMLRQQQVIAEERARISSDMHDDLGADLSNLLLLTRLTRRSEQLPNEERRQVSNIEQYAKGIIEKVDEIIWSLDPSNDSLNGLITFIGDYSRNLVELSGIKISIEGPEDISNRDVSAVFRRNIFLSVKEALNNIIKHSEASVITMKISFENDEFHIYIGDNGRGFTIRDPRHQDGNGLSNMQRRMEELSGNFSIESDFGGTNIFMKAPVS